MNTELLNELFTAYFSARRNKRNTMNQLQFEVDMESHLVNLAVEIEEQTYTPKRSVCFIVNEPVKREIFAADFKDRVVHHLIHQQIAPMFENIFIEDSYACRKGRGTLFGISRLEHHIKSCSQNYKKECYVLKLDIQGYFMSINRQLLFNKIHLVINKKWELFCANNKYNGTYLPKETLLYLLEKMIFCNPITNCLVKGNQTDWKDLPQSKSLFHSDEGCGLPIGNLTSQLFSNIYLNDLDQYIKRDLKIKHYGRYVDDFYIIHEDKEYLIGLIKTIRKYLSAELKLILHPKKIYLQNVVKGVSFLGMVVKPYRRYAGRRIVKNLNRYLYLHSNISSTEALGLSTSLNSYLGLLKHSKSYNLRRKIVHQTKCVFRYGWIRNDYAKYKLFTAIQ